MSRHSARDRLPLRVFKLGGSLFDLPDLGRRVWRWLYQQPPATSVVIAGGGDCAEAIRRWDQVHRLGESFCHEQCGRVLSITARLTWRLLATDGRPVAWSATLSDVRKLVVQPEPLGATTTTSRLIVLDAGQFLLSEEPQAPGDVLPATWDVTSDSIAARAAELLDADELVLGKSTSEPHGSLDSDRRDWTRLAQSGLVDRHFPRVAPRVRRIRVIDLRGELAHDG